MSIRSTAGNPRGRLLAFDRRGRHRRCGVRRRRDLGAGDVGTHHPGPRRVGGCGDAGGRAGGQDHLPAQVLGPAVCALLRAGRGRLHGGEPEGRDRDPGRERPGRQGQAADSRRVQQAPRRLLLMGRGLHQEVRPRRSREGPHRRCHRRVEGQLHPGGARGLHLRRQALRRADHPRRQVHGLQHEALRRQRRRRPDDDGRAARRLRHLQVEGLRSAGHVRQRQRLAGDPLHDPAQPVLRSGGDAGDGLRPGDRRLHRPGLQGGPRRLHGHQLALPDPGRQRHHP